MALVNTLGGKPLLDPAHLLRECLTRNLPTANWQGRATIAHCPAGRRWGTAAVLMSLGDLSALDLTADHDLTLSDFRRPVTLKRYSVLAAEAVVPGLKDDPATPYLVLAVDRRYHLDRSPFSKGYNVPNGAGGLVAATTNGGTPWTWATMVADLWALLPPTPAGVAPTLPFVPDGRPEGWRFWGHPSAWGALNDVLDRLCCVLVYDPTADTFAVERQGAVDAAADAFALAAKNDLAWDGRPVVPKRTARPENLLVRFRRDPAPANGSDPFYSVTLTLTATPGTVAGTTLMIADDLTALGATGSPSNAAALATRAAERKTDFERSLTPAEKTRVSVWRGLWPTAVAEVGASAGGVAWGDRGSGWTTEVGVSDPPHLNGVRLDDLPTASGGGSLTTANVNASGASDAATTTITFDQSTGIKKAGTSGTAAVSLYAAAVSQMGAITTAFQDVGGLKRSAAGSDTILPGWYAVSDTPAVAAYPAAFGTWIPYSASLSVIPSGGVSSGSINLQLQSVASTYYSSPLNTPQVVAIIRCNNGFFLGTGIPSMNYLTFVTSSTDSQYVCAGLILPASGGTPRDGSFAVSRTGVFKPGIDRVFAAGDRAIVAGGIIIGYNNP
jgi:hypothetical protein